MKGKVEIPSELPSFYDRRQKSVCLNQIEKAKSRFYPDGHPRATKPCTMNIAENKK